ncbi:hypothetical protein ACFPFV_12695 [Salinicoccus siamensis]
MMPKVLKQKSNRVEVSWNDVLKNSVKLNNLFRPSGDIPLGPLI